jgi:hypothetical protein
MDFQALAIGIVFGVLIGIGCVERFPSIFTKRYRKMNLCRILNLLDALTDKEFQLLEKRMEGNKK